MLSDKELEEFTTDYRVSFNQVKTKLSFGGKTLEEWCTEFNFVIPDEVDFLEVIELNKIIDGLTSIAHNNYAISWSTYQLLKRARDKKAVKAYTKMLVDGVRRPSVNEGDNRVSSECSDEDDKLAIAKVFVDFWEEQKKLLEKRSKIVESMFWSMKQHKEVTE